MEPIDVARDALARIGDGWEAADEEREVLDFKETPETALPPQRRARANMGRERKRFLGMTAGTAPCLANGNGGVTAIGVRNAAGTRTEAFEGADPSCYSVHAVRLAGRP